MYSKNYKSFEPYILLNLIHLISMATTSLQFIMHRGIGITHPFLISLPLLLASSDVPDSGTCADPTTIAAAHTRAWTPPRRLRQLARRHNSGSHLSPFPLSFFSMPGHNTFVYARQMKQDKAPTKAVFTFTIYHTNKQGTKATCIYHQHAKHKQTSVKSAPTHAHIQIAHACMQIRHRPPCKIRHRPPCKVRHRPFAC
jgi:hypothetical protein